MKMNIHISKWLCIATAVTASWTATSCDDFLTLLPEDSTVEEDYWQTGSQVEAVVMACYRFMQEDDFMQRLIYWGEMRSDNVVSGSSVSTEETNLMNAVILSDNSLVKWEAFYEVINYCNHVIAKAPGVTEIDANFRQDELNSYMAEAYTIRALCYFYLVRTFGDVPLVLTPSSSDAEDYNVPQSTEAEILDQLISDLQTAHDLAPVSWDSDTETKGRVTRNAVCALLADVCLWKGAVNETVDAEVAAGAYQTCIDMCDEVLADKTQELELLEGNEFFTNVFYSGCSRESIFELVFDTDGHSNNGTSTLYGNTNKSKNPHMRANSDVANLFNPNLTGDMQEYDYRSKDFYVSSTSNIFKYEGRSPSSEFGGGGTYTYRSSSSEANWIFYRLSDIYLMKAEALTSISDGDQEKLQNSLTLVNTVYKRSCSENGVVQDSFLFENYNSVSSMQSLVLEERRREFLFEGKRWYDLLRKVRREDSTADAWELLSSKYDDDVTLIESKLSVIDAWYLPIWYEEMSVNTNLQQNEYYQTLE